MTEDTEAVEAEVVDPIEIDDLVEPQEKPVRRRKPPEIKDPDDAILELREENKKLRKKLEVDSMAKAEKLAEERIKVAREEAVAEAQKKLDERIKEMEERSKSRVMKSELKASAARAGVADFEDLFAVMQHLNFVGKIEFDPDGNVTNANEVIAELKTSKPHLFAGVSTSSTTAPPQARQQVVDRPALQMSKADYERAKHALNRM